MNGQAPLTREDRFFDALFSGWFNAQSEITIFIIVALLIFFLICAILVPINIYFAQRHARLCRNELRKQTQILQNIALELKPRPIESQEDGHISREI